MYAKWSPENRLSGLWFEGQKYFPQGLQAEYGASSGATSGATNSVASRASGVIEGAGEKREVLEQRLSEGLSAYFAGRAGGWQLLQTIPLAPKGTAFQQTIWQLLREIPDGETATYGQLAEAAKAGKAAQAVGGAVGRNPISILIPCHRVIGAKGQLTGYAGGLDRKAHLLALEKSNKKRGENE